MFMTAALGTILAPLFANARPLCLAHRAEHATHGENSLPAIREALALGADGVEIDLRHTTDGVAVGVHDKILWRIAADKPGKHCPTFSFIENLSLSEIHDNCALKNSEEISTLQEILDSLKDSHSFLLLQLKDMPSAKTVSLVHDFPDKNRLRIHSFWDSCLDRFDEMANDQGFKVPSLKISKYIPRISEVRGNDLWWPFRRLLSLKQNLRQREVGLFLVDTETELAEAIKLPVNFISTDRPSICKKLAGPIVAH